MPSVWNVRQLLVLAPHISPNDIRSLRCEKTNPMAVHGDEEVYDLGVWKTKVDEQTTCYLVTVACSGP